MDPMLSVLGVDRGRCVSALEVTLGVPTAGLAAGPTPVWRECVVQVLSVRTLEEGPPVGACLDIT